MMDSKVIIQSTRAPFLILTPACIILGLGTAVAYQPDINLNFLGLALLGGLLAHISVNTLNEYFDFRTGLDLLTIKTPFSGGSGALPAKPLMLNAVLAVGIASLIATLMIGLFFIWQYGMGIFPLGLIGVLLIIFYTGWINKYPYFCLVAPGIGFGVLMVVGTQYVLVGQYLPLSSMVAVVPFLLVNNLLLLNQYPDIEADSQVGRNHLPIAYGIKRSNIVYGLSALAATVAIVAYILVGFLPTLSLISILPLPLAVYALSGAVKYGENIGSYPQYLAANVAVSVLTPLLLGISLIYG
jgi:1,4-dihydroxy-2-naphthoate octaprenyltransferase